MQLTFRFAEERDAALISLGAESMTDWTVYRLAGPRLENLGRVPDDGL